jgi:hypothetical protein
MGSYRRKKKVWSLVAGADAGIAVPGQGGRTGGPEPPDGADAVDDPEPDHTRGPAPCGLRDPEHARIRDLDPSGLDGNGAAAPRDGNGAAGARTGAVGCSLIRPGPWPWPCSLGPWPCFIAACAFFFVGVLLYRGGCTVRDTKKSIAHRLRFIISISPSSSAIIAHRLCTHIVCRHYQHQSCSCAALQLLHSTFPTADGGPHVTLTRDPGWGWSWFFSFC